MRFARLEPLVGEKGLTKLLKSHVLVFGLGGVGSYAVEALARSGVGSLTLVDKDTVETTNINRQLEALDSNLGKLKVDVVARRIADIHPVCRVIGRYETLTPENLETFFKERPDYVLDCIDDVPAKVALATYCVTNGISFLASMGTACRMHPEAIRITTLAKTQNDPLARAMRQKFAKTDLAKKIRVVTSEELPIPPQKASSALPSSAFVPAAAGLAMASQVILDLTSESEVSS